MTLEKPLKNATRAGKAAVGVFALYGPQVLFM